MSRPLCDCCGKPTRPGRRTRCRIGTCDHLFGLCCQGDLCPATCTCCHQEMNSAGSSRPLSWKDDREVRHSETDSEGSKNEEPTFTLSQLHSMWFKYFHKAGELYFLDVLDDEICKRATEDSFRDFLESTLNTIDPLDTDN